MTIVECGERILIERRRCAGIVEMMRNGVMVWHPTDLTMVVVALGLAAALQDVPLRKVVPIVGFVVLAYWVGRFG